MTIRNDNNDVFVGDVGTVLEFDTGENLSTATSVSITVTKPDGTSVFWTATTSDTKIVYTTLTDDLNQVGEYILQPYAEFPTWNGYGSRCYLLVQSHE